MPISLLTFTAVATFTCGAYFAHAKYLKPKLLRKEKQYEEKFIDDAWNSVVKSLAERERLDERQLATEFTLLRDGSKLNTEDFLGVKQIDCDYLKAGPTSVRRLLTVGYHRGEDVRLLKIEQTLEWTDLPRVLRREFIRSGNQSESFRMYPVTG